MGAASWAASDGAGRATGIASGARAAVPATTVASSKNLRMKVARVEAGLSQAELAAVVGATRQTVGLIEAGGYNPTLKLCLAICHALGKTLDDLVWEEG